MKHLGTLIATAIFAFGGMAGAAAQENWPTKPITLVVPFAAGTSVDIVARQMAGVIEKDLGQRVLAVNRVGAGGSIGARVAAHSAPDGYTFVFGSISSHAANVSLMNNIGYDPIADFAPVVRYAEAASVLAVNPKVGATTLKEFLDVARSRPVSVASTAVGSVAYLADVLLNVQAGIKTKIVPYSSGASAVLDVIAGEVDATIYTLPFLQPHLEAGTLIPLAVTGTKRMSALPNVPTFAEAGYPGVSVTAWYAVYAPKDTPKAIVERMNKEINGVLSSAETLQFLASQSMTPLGGSPEDLAAFTQSEIDKFAKLIALAGIEKQ